MNVWFVIGLIVLTVFHTTTIITGEISILFEDCETAYNHQTYYVNRCNEIHLQGYIMSGITYAFAFGLIYIGLKEMKKVNYVLVNSVAVGLTLFTPYWMVGRGQIDCNIINQLNETVVCNNLMLSVFIVPFFIIIPLSLLIYLFNNKERFIIKESKQTQSQEGKT